MQVFLVKQNSKFSVFKYLFKTIEIKDDIIILNRNLEKMKQKKKIKIARKLGFILKRNDSGTVILSKKLKEDKEFSNLLYSNQIDIITGKKLFNGLLEQIFENRTIKEKKQDYELAIATNYNDKWIVNLIIKLSKKYKTVKVVSNNLNYFKTLQEKLLEEEGIVITTTNNKRKAMIKSNIIINIDFPEEILNKYNIYEKCTIINLEERVKIHKKRFCGKIINDYEIELKEDSNIFNDLKKEKYKAFDLKDLTECYLLNKPEEFENVKAILEI